MIASNHKMPSTFMRLLAFAWPLKASLLLSALLGMATVASGIGLMSTSAYLISEAALHPSVAALGVSIVGVRFFGISRGIFRYLERYVSHHVALSITARLRTWFYSAVEPLAPARLMHYKGGDLLSRSIADIETLQDFYVRAVYPPLVAALVAVVLWVLLGAFDPLFALVFLACYLMAGVGLPILSHLLGKQLGKEIIQARADLNAQLTDSIKGISDLIAFGQQKTHVERINSLNHTLVSLQKRMSWVNGLETGLGSFLMNIALWLMLIVSIPFVQDGRLDGVYMAVLLLATLAGFEAVLPLPGAARNLGASLEAARRLFEVVDASPAAHDPATSALLPGNYSVSFRDVSFRYNNDESPVLENISFNIPQGECLALVGPSGAGKSTVSNLLLRFWDYAEGEITIGGQDLRLFSGEDARKMIGVVSQNSYLFNTTIRANLLVARPEASDEDLIDALEKAQLYSFVQSLPLGLDTSVGEDGVRLSGGERQRLAIARAYLKDAPILILDEPTANLDAVTEQAVFAALRPLAQGRTTLLITHRLVGLEIADKVLLLKGGKTVSS